MSIQDTIEDMIYSVINTGCQNTDEIDAMISQGLLQKSENGILYGIIEPEIDLHPDKCIVLCYGRGSICSAYRMVTGLHDITTHHKSKLNVKTLIFNYYNQYGSDIISGKVEDIITSTMEEVLRKIDMYTHIPIGYSLGCYSASKYGRDVVALICPFDVQSIGFTDICNLYQNISESNKHYLIYATKYDIMAKVDYIKEKLKSIDPEKYTLIVHDGDHFSYSCHNELLQELVQNLLTNFN